MVILRSGVAAGARCWDSTLVWSVNADVDILPHVRHVRLVSENQVVVHRSWKIFHVEDDNSFLFNHDKTVPSPGYWWNVFSSVWSNTSFKGGIFSFKDVEIQIWEEESWCYKITSSSFDMWSTHALASHQIAVVVVSSTHIAIAFSAAVWCSTHSPGLSNTNVTSASGGVSFANTLSSYRVASIGARKSAQRIAVASCASFWITFAKPKESSFALITTGSLNVLFASALSSFQADVGICHSVTDTIIQ